MMFRPSRLASTLLLALASITGAEATTLLVGVDPETGESRFFIASGIGKVEQAPAVVELVPFEVAASAYALGALQVIDAAGPEVSAEVIESLSDLLLATQISSTIEALIRNNAERQQESQALLEQMQNRDPSSGNVAPDTEPPSGNPLHAAINQALLQAITGSAIDADTINTIITQAQAQMDGSAAARPGPSPEFTEQQRVKMEQTKRLEQQRQQQMEEQKQRKEALAKQNQQLLDKIKQQKEQQQKEKLQAQEQARRKAEENLMARLDQKQKEELLARKQQLEQSDRSNNSPEREPGGSGPDQSGPDLAGNAPATGSAPSAALAAALQALNDTGNFNPEDFNTMESFADHIGATYDLDLGAILGTGTIEGEFDVNSLIAALTRLSLADVNTDFANEAARQQAVTETAQEVAQQLAGSRSWADFTFYNSEQYFPDELGPTRALDGSDNATYTGLVRSNEDGIAASGTITMDFTFSSGAVSGQIDFDNNMGGLTLQGNVDQNYFGTSAFGEALGGTAGGSLNGNFFGPNAEEIGGSWDVTVSGSPLGEHAGGDFAAKQ